VTVTDSQWVSSTNLFGYIELNRVKESKKK